MATTTATGASSASSTQAAVREAVGGARKRLGNRKASYGFLFVSPKIDLAGALNAASQLVEGAEILGCTTAGEITEAGSTHGGMAAMLVASDQQFAVDYTRNAKEPARAVDELSRSLRKMRRGEAKLGTTVLLIDGLSGTGEEVVDRLYQEAGGAVREIVGGAAGDDGRFTGTWVGARGQVTVGGAAALHLGESRWGVGVDHGLTPATKPMRVTRAEGNVVHEIDGRPSFEVYEEYARERGVELTRDNASQFLINNELGVLVFDTMKKARAPLSVTPAGGLACAAEVPQGASVCILGGNRDALVAAARRAAAEAKERLGARRAAGVLIFDCICRGAILGDEFQREIDAVRQVFPGIPVAGFLTYGEIARYSGRLDGWHNTTAVVAAIAE